MSRWAVLTASLTGVYLLVLASLKPGDVAMGAVLSATLAALIVRRGRPTPEAGERSMAARLVGSPRFVAGAIVDVATGAWHVAAVALGRRPLEHPGFVEIPIGDRSEVGVVVWGLLTGLSPDEIVVDIDEERGVALIHVLDDRDPEAVRRRHRETYENTTRKVFP